MTPLQDPTILDKSVLNLDAFAVLMHDVVSHSALKYNKPNHKCQSFFILSIHHPLTQRKKMKRIVIPKSISKVFFTLLSGNL